MKATIGTAGWALPAAVRGDFGEGASNLARYATRFNGVEINSSFHRSHRSATWEAWAETVPAEFRFAAKLPKTITHQARLLGCEALADAFLAETEGLGSKLAVVLVQLPPSLAFDAAVAGPLLDRLVTGSRAAVACEPRHASWFDEAVDEWLAARRIARVAADPALCPAAARPGGARQLAYRRLHGSPRIYRSPYEPLAIAAYAEAIRALPAGTDAWCMFDNTASSAATANALELVDALGG